MKKNNLTLIIILAVIAFLHFIFIYLFFVKNDAETSKPEPGPIPKPTVIMPSGNNPTLSDEPAAVHQKKKYPRQNERFDYAKCVSGKLNAVPEIKFIRNGILVNVDTGKVLWASGPREAVPIASMTKMMTLLIALKEIESRHIDMDTTVTVSRTAVLVKPTRAGLKPNDKIPLRKLLQSMIIKSANDSAMQVAEFIGGTADKFYEMMNAEAQALGMTSSAFFSPHGLPASTAKKDNRGSCEDMAILGNALMQYPQAREWVATREFVFRGEDTAKPEKFRNHNYLLNSKKCPGVDGIKTGFTQRAGFCITASCERGGTRLIAVIAGCSDSKTRDELVKKLFNWGYARLGIK